MHGATVQCETDHKPLVSIFKKALADCPLRIQSLLLTIQRYDLKVGYIPGSKLIPADTLSRAPDSKTPHSAQVSKEIEIHIERIISTMPFSDHRLRCLNRKFLGIEKSRGRGREVLYCPGINNDMKHMVENCPRCVKFSNIPKAEPLKPHEVPIRP